MREILKLFFKDSTDRAANVVFNQIVSDVSKIITEKDFREIIKKKKKELMQIPKEFLKKLPKQFDTKLLQKLPKQVQKQLPKELPKKFQKDFLIKLKGCLQFRRIFLAYLLMHGKVLTRIA